MDPRAVIVCADHEQAVLWADAAPADLRAHAVTGLARTAALLKERRGGVPPGAYPDPAPLVSPPPLKIHTIETVVLPWPGGFPPALHTPPPETPPAPPGILSWTP